MEFTEREIQILHYAIRSLLFEIEDEQSYESLKQTDRKKLKNNFRTSKAILNKLEDHMTKNHIEKDSNILTNITEIDDFIIEGYKL